MKNNINNLKNIFSVKTIFLDPNPKKKFSDPQQCYHGHTIALEECDKNNNLICQYAAERIRMDILEIMEHT
jgi:hypothetical protein